jgi:hypothetical protein
VATLKHSDLDSRSWVICPEYLHLLSRRNIEKMNKRSALLLLPPVGAGLFFVAITAAYSPLIPLVFIAWGLPIGAITFALVYSSARGFFHMEPPIAMEWTLIATAWVSVIAWYVLSELYWCELIGC